MSFVRIIGDVHGKIDQYKKITDDCSYSIQIGDIGFKNEWKRVSNEISGDKHKIIAGNHDDYDTLINVENYFGDFGLTTHGGMNFFYVRGAYSLDSKERTMDIDIWPEKEELNYGKLNQVIDQHEKFLPEIVLTHDAPKEATYSMFRPTWHYPSRTVEALDQMFKIHQPKLWIFGHWHRTIFKKVNDTFFICLGELDYVDYDNTKVVRENVELIIKQLWDMK